MTQPGWGSEVSIVEQKQKDSDLNITKEEV